MSNVNFQMEFIFNNTIQIYQNELGRGNCFLMAYFSLVGWVMCSIPQTTPPISSDLNGTTGQCLVFFLCPVLLNLRYRIDHRIQKILSFWPHQAVLRAYSRFCAQVSLLGAGIKPRLVHAR